MDTLFHRVAAMSPYIAVVPGAAVAVVEGCTAKGETVFEVGWSSCVAPLEPPRARCSLADTRCDDGGGPPSLAVPLCTAASVELDVEGNSSRCCGRNGGEIGVHSSAPSPPSATGHAEGFACSSRSVFGLAACAAEVDGFCVRSEPSLHSRSLCSVFSISVAAVVAAAAAAATASPLEAAMICATI